MQRARHGQIHARCGSKTEVGHCDVNPTSHVAADKRRFELGAC